MGGWALLGEHCLSGCRRQLTDSRVCERERERERRETRERERERGRGGLGFGVKQFPNLNTGLGARLGALFEEPPCVRGAQFMESWSGDRNARKQNKVGQAGCLAPEALLCGTLP